MDVFLVEKLAAMRLNQRCVDLDRATLLFRVAPGEGVAVPRAEWNAIGGHFRTRIRRSASYLRCAIWLQIPVALLLLTAVARHPAWQAAIDRVDAAVPGLPLLAFTVTLPLLAAIHHNAVVLRTVREIVCALSVRPRIASLPPKSSRALHLLEIVALIWFGPGVFVQWYASLFPHAFDGTPWMGRRLAWDGVVGLLAFLALLLFHVRRRSDARAAAQP